MTRVTIERAEELAAKWKETRNLETRIKDGVVQYRCTGARRWTNSNVVTTGNIVHKFEAAGLGKAPFQILRVETRTYQACPGAPVQVGTCCDFCGTGIKETYIIASADGGEFKVGNQCVRKTGDRGLIIVVKAKEAEKRRAAAEKRHDARVAAQQEREEKAAERLQDPAIREALEAQASPTGRGTALDYCEFMLGSQGTYPIQKAIRIVMETK